MALQIIQPALADNIFFTFQRLSEILQGPLNRDQTRFQQTQDLIANHIHVGHASDWTWYPTAGPNLLWFPRSNYQHGTYRMFDNGDLRMEFGIPETPRPRIRMTARLSYYFVIDNVDIRAMASVLHNNGVITCPLDRSHVNRDMIGERNYNMARRDFHDYGRREMCRHMHWMDLGEFRDHLIERRDLSMLHSLFEEDFWNAYQSLFEMPDLAWFEQDLADE